MPNAFPVNNNTNSNSNNNNILPTFPQSGVISTQDKSNDSPDPRRNSTGENYDSFLVATSQYYHMNNNNDIVSDSNTLKEMSPEKSIQKQNSDETNQLGIEGHALSLHNKTAGGDPLDLSKPDATDVSSEASVTYVTPSALNTSTSVKTSKHRRKGQAYKLDHISRKLQQQYVSHNVPESEGKLKDLPERMESLINTQHTEEGKTKEKQDPESELRKVNEDLPKVEARNKQAHERNLVTGSKSEVYHCSYCDITFSDIVLYSMHKGYHGYQDPFTCNMCGVQTADKVEFFLHVARSSHS
jgi:hunchback-like protein